MKLGIQRVVLTLRALGGLRGSLTTIDAIDGVKPQGPFKTDDVHFIVTNLDGMIIEVMQAELERGRKGITTKTIIRKD